LRGNPAVARFRRGRRWTAANFEDSVHVVDEELEFLVGEVAVVVELFEFGGLGFGAGSAVFFDVGIFVTGPGEGMNQTGESLSVATKLLVEVAGVNVPKGEEKAREGELEGGLIELGIVEIVAKVEGGFLVGTEVFEPLLLEEPALVMRTGMPTGDIARGDMPGLVTEQGRNLLVSDAITDQAVELVASGFGEAANFAMGTAFGFLGSLA